MIKLFNFIIIMCLSFTISYTQDEILYDANANFEDENFEVALKQFLKLYKKKQYINNPEINYKLGVCYLYTNYDKSKALKHLLFADSVYPKGFKDIDFYLAQAYFHNYNFDKAKELLKKYIKENPAKEFLPTVDLLLEQIKTAQRLIQKPLNVKFINLGRNINSPQDDYIPFITEDENFMVFSSNRRYLSDFQEYVKGVFFSSRTPSGWEVAKAASSKINTDEHEEAAGISKDGNILLVHVNRMKNPDDLFYSEKNKMGNFGELKDFGPNINTKYRECGASLSYNGDTLYFASDRIGGKGGYDIYYSVKLPDGKWSQPVNLGEPINTQYDENFPYITSDGKTLYFCSNGPKSMGGYDIFISKKIDTTWSEPVNIGYPINDTYDNYNISLTSNRRYGFISKYDTSSVGGLDIYKVIFEDVPPTPVAYTGTIFIGDSISGLPYRQVDSLITFTVYNLKNNQSYNYTPTKKSKYTLAFTPGEWLIEIKGKEINTYTQKIVINDEQPIQSVIFKNIYLSKITPQKTMKIMQQQKQIKK
ncbi:MAG: hypothetical protein N3A01_01760 [Bacteroidales bacterium]|nr:hypothetical protein [Bacteroidales bacterium]